MNDTDLRALLEGATTIAVVGASTNPPGTSDVVVGGYGATCRALL